MKFNLKVLKNWNINKISSKTPGYLTINLLITIILFQIPLFSLAQQKILIKGIIVDKSNDRPIPFSNIVLSGLKTGTISQNDGMFSIQVPKIPDTLNISAIGYQTEHIPIINNIQNIFKIELIPLDVEIGEIIIIPGENPANIIMRKVISLKDKNNPLNAQTIACNAYTKVLTNSVSDRENKFHEKSGLPIFFSEKFTQNYLQQNPFFEKEIVISERLSGLGIFNEFDIFGVSNNIKSDLNFYKNIIEIFDKPFISPLSTRAFSHYKFYLRDSTMSEFGKEYVIEFIPKNLSDLTFSGHLKIIDEMWAMSEISTKIPVDANLNYINKLEVFQTFKPVNDSLTFYDTNELLAELKITKDNALFNINLTAIVDKRTIYSNVKLNFPPIISGKDEIDLNTLLPLPALTKPDSLILILRPEILSPKEKRSIAIIDSVNNNWKVKTADAISRMFITGYIPGKYFDIGPYLELIKNNRIEGYRFTLSGRTSANFTKNTMFYGHIGYGLTDREWKYGIGLQHKFKNQFRRVITFDYRNDLSRIGDNRSIYLIKENMMVSGEDNVIAALFNNYPLDKLSREISYRSQYEHEWERGFTNIISFNHRNISSGLYLPFTKNGTTINNFSSNELTLGARLSWDEAFTDNYCRRFYMTTQYPIINIRLTGGQYQIGNISDYFLSTRIVLNHDINFGLTKFEYLFEVGVIFGIVPFPLLEIHRTNQSLGYSLYSFNMMKDMEFASDQFLSLMAQYHLNGLFFNKVPLLKKIGLREVFSAKVLWSQLSQKQQQYLDFPSNLSDTRIPYAEFSAGIENIFQYFRTDVVFRFSQKDTGKNIPTGIRVRFDFNF